MLSLQQMQLALGALTLPSLLCCGRIDYDLVASVEDASVVDAGSEAIDARTFDAGTPSTLPFVSATQIGGTGSTACYSLGMNAAGQHAITGKFSGTNDFGEGDVASAGSADVYISVFNPNGTMAWTDQFGTGEAQGGNGVLLDETGRTYVVGEHRGTMDLGGGALANQGDMDLFGSRFDGTGTHQWSSSGGSPSGDIGHALAVATDGSSAVVGSVLSGSSYDGILVASKGSRDGLVARIDSLGNTVWSQSIGGIDTDQATAVTLLPSGSTVVGGSFQSSVDFGGGTARVASGTAGYLVALDSTGGYEWDLTIDGMDTEFVGGLASDSAGNVYAVGDYSANASIGSMPLPAPDSKDAFLVSLRQDGSLRWVRTFTGSESETLHGVAHRSGKVYVTGFYSGTIVDASLPSPPPVSAGTRVGIILVLSSEDGTLLSANYIPGATTLGIGASADGLVAVSGYFSGAVDFGDGEITSKGSQDSFIVRFQE